MEFIKNMLATAKDRFLTHWKSTVIGLTESVGITGVGTVMNDPKAAKMAFALALWRLVMGALSRDAGKPEA